MSYLIEKKSIDSVKMNRFLKKTAKVTARRELTVYLDNSSVHRSRAVTAYANSIGIKFIYSPPYSPSYQPIEQLWNHSKRIWRRCYLKQRYSNDFDSMLKAVENSIKAVPKKLLRKTVLDCVKRMKHALEELSSSGSKDGRQSSLDPDAIA